LYESGADFVTLKQRIVLSLGWLVLCVVIGFAIIIPVASSGATSRERNERASMVGVGMGTVVGIGWAGLWLPWAAALGRQRRDERERARRKPKRGG
jgi:hypothetical protein